MVDFDGETTVIAELANAHQGDLSTAVEMIERVATAADAVKIQVFSAADVVVSSHEDHELLDELSLSRDDVERLVEVAHDHGLEILADVEGPDGISRVEGADIDGFKIHSSDLAHQALLERVAALDKPMILSAGGVTPIELRKAIETIEATTSVPLSLVYGFQNYPTELDDTHLARLRELIDRFDYPVGYTSHLDGGTDLATQLPAWAVAAGASFVEVHVTLDRAEEGIDYYSSLEPTAFEEMADTVEKAKTAVGERTIALSGSELSYRNSHKKCVLATRAIEAGERIGPDDVTVRRPVDDPERAYKTTDPVVGQTARTDIPRSQPIGRRHLTQRVVATLACRSESTRLYGKPLQLLGDKPIIAHQVDQLRAVDAVDEVVLAISDAPSQTAYIDFAESRDLPYVVGYPENVVGRLVAAGREVDADLVLRSTTENPFLHYGIVDDVVTAARNTQADLVAPRKLPFGSFVEVFDLAALADANRLGDDRHRSEHVASFLTENPESFDILGIEPEESLQRPDIRLTVDNPSDLVLVRRLWESVGSARDPYDLGRIIERYDEAELGSLNADKPDGETPSVAEDAWHIYGDPAGRMRLVDSVDEFPTVEGDDG